MKMLQALPTTEFHVVILPHTDSESVQWILLALFTTTLILSGFSTLITGMSVSSLPVSLGTRKLLLLLFLVYYSHECRSNKAHVKMFSIIGRVIRQNEIVRDSS